MTGHRSSRSAERPSTTITRVSLPVPDDFNFWRTVQSHGWCVLPPFACDRKRRELERVVTISPGLSAHCLLRGGEGAVTCTIRGMHPLSRQEKDTVAAALRTCLRLDEDFTAFEDTAKMICTTHHDRLIQPAEPRMRPLLLLLFSAWTVQTVAQPLVLDMDVFAARRTAFGQLMEPQSVAILPSSPESRWNPDVKYRQENNFYYVSGFEEPESMLLINPSAPRTKYVLFVRERDPKAELYEGSRTGREGAMDTYGADTALYTKDFDRVIHSLIPHDCTIYYPFGVNSGMDDHVKGLFIEGRSGALWPIIDPSPLLAGMRLIKNEGDWRMGLRRAVEISVAGHTEAMKSIRPGIYEYEVQAGILKRMEAAGYTEEELAQYSPVLTPYLNIGVRIEDDIAVTEDGHRVLSQAVPRTIADIERLMEEAGLDER